jgi:hypothetical protein
MSNQQLLFLYGVIMFTVANIFRPWLLGVFVSALFICAAWCKP